MQQNATSHEKWSIQKAKYNLSSWLKQKGPLWLWSYGSWIYNYLCNQCLSPLIYEFESCSLRGVLDTAYCDKICQRLATGQ
jgi:hypothetical protein